MNQRVPEVSTSSTEVPAVPKSPRRQPEQDLGGGRGRARGREPSGNLGGWGVRLVGGRGPVEGAKVGGRVKTENLGGPVHSGCLSFFAFYLDFPLLGAVPWRVFASLGVFRRRGSKRLV